MSGCDEVLEGRIKRQRMILAHKQVCEEKQAEAEQHVISALDEEAEPQEVSDHALRKRQCRLLHVVEALFQVISTSS